MGSSLRSTREIARESVFQTFNASEIVLFLRSLKAVNLFRHHYMPRKSK